MLGTLRDMIDARSSGHSRRDKQGAIHALFHEAPRVTAVDRNVFQRALMHHLALKASPEALSALFSKWSTRAGFLDIDRLLKLLEPGGSAGRGRGSPVSLFELTVPAVIQ